MRYWVVCCALLLMASCAPKEPPLPPVPPMPADLSPDTWSAPTLVQLPPPPPAPEPPKPEPAPNEKLYAYKPQKEYVVPIQLGWPADIVLEPGEKVHAIAAGDRGYLVGDEAPKWEVKEGISESEYTPISHVFITATHAGLKQGLVITTSRRTYHLTVKSVNRTSIRTVRWTYPAKPAPAVVKKPPSILPDPTVPQKYHIGYRIESPGPLPDWAPVWLGDTGQKTYIIFPATMLYQDAPLVRGIGVNGPFLVNSRQLHTVVIIDRLLQHAELRIGTGEHAQVLTVRRGDLHTITCPGNGACPNWPGATLPTMAQEVRP